MQKTESVSDSVDITVPDIGFVFSISFLVFNFKNILIFSSALSYHCFI
jgi:hypothetical protein